MLFGANTPVKSKKTKEKKTMTNYKEWQKETPENGEERDILYAIINTDEGKSRKYLCVIKHKENSDFPEAPVDFYFDATCERCCWYNYELKSKTIEDAKAEAEKILANKILENAKEYSRKLKENCEILSLLA